MDHPMDHPMDEWSSTGRRIGEVEGTHILKIKNMSSGACILMIEVSTGGMPMEKRFDRSISVLALKVPTPSPSPFPLPFSLPST